MNPIFFESLTHFLTLAGWIIVLVIIQSYTRRYTNKYVTEWVRPLIRFFYLFDLAWAARSVAMILADTFPHLEVVRTVVFFVSQLTLWALATVLMIHYRRVPKYLARISLHKLNSDRFKTITDSCHDAIFETDSGGTLMYCNPAGAKIFGYDSYSQLEGSNVTVLMPPSFREMHLVGMKRFIETGVSVLLDRAEPIELLGQKRDGEIFPIELTLGKYKINEKWRFTTIIRDITKRKTLEAHQQ